MYRLKRWLEISNVSYDSTMTHNQIRECPFWTRGRCCKSFSDTKHLVCGVESCHAGWSVYKETLFYLGITSQCLWACVCHHPLTGMQQVGKNNLVSVRQQCFGVCVSRKHPTPWNSNSGIQFFHLQSKHTGREEQSRVYKVLYFFAHESSICKIANCQVFKQGAASLFRKLDS